MWNVSLKLTGNWQKDSCTTKAVRKIHLKFSKKGRNAIRLGPVPLRGDSEEERDYMGRNTPWGVSRLSHRLGVPVLGPAQRRQILLAGWRTSATNRKTGRSF